MSLATPAHELSLPSNMITVAVAQVCMNCFISSAHNSYFFGQVSR